ncbi:MAG: hypothetical protein RBT79_09160 [Chiayiivirga sp.]|jgi:hypothetical protein|uniref:Uncharacterized protein n=1 Tax=Denitratimonas tolerans TaxID=1338420 RepID=A0AAW9R9L7_9GAMM|nr:hypothetical protein [Xanthomonadaceae bacterium]MDX9765126.1 hypothetical protein [Chiayiivirga sp.]
MSSSLVATGVASAVAASSAGRGGVAVPAKPDATIRNRDSINLVRMAAAP